MCLLKQMRWIGLTKLRSCTLLKMAAVGLIDGLIERWHLNVDGG
jgi:hypothetical protein